MRYGSVVTFGAGLVLGLSIWFARAPRARAPEPATLTATMDSIDSVGPGCYQSQIAPSLVKKWTSSYTTCGTAVDDGQPCTTVPMSAGDTTDKVIQRTGSLCRCL